MLRPDRNPRPSLTFAFALAPALFSMAWLAAGCDSTSFVPPKPPELNALSDARPQISSRPVAVILAPGPKTSETESWLQTARLEAGKARVPFGETKPAPGSPPTVQADLIRDALAKNPSVIMLDPVDAPEVAKALNEARARAVPVLLLGRRISGLDASRPFPLVRFAPAGDSVRKLIQAVRDDAKEFKLADDGHALVVLDTDSGADDMAAALESTLKNAGVSNVSILRFTGNFEAGVKAVRAGVDADPKITMLVAADQAALNALMGVRNNLKDSRKFVCAGCTSLDIVSLGTLMFDTAGLIERSVPVFSREASRLALRMAKGESTPEDTELPVMFAPRPKGTAAAVPIISPPPAFPGSKGVE